MSCPSLYLACASSATIGDVDRYFFLDHNANNPVRDRWFEYLTPVGGVVIGFGERIGLGYKDFCENATLYLSFRCGYFWEIPRNNIVLGLCRWLSDEFGGQYYAEFDTGAPFFLIKDGTLTGYEKQPGTFQRKLLAFRDWTPASY